MTLLPPNVKVHLALGYVDMRKGIDGLAMLVRGVPRQDPFAGWLALPFSPMFWLPNTAITSLFAVKARSSPGKASSWIVRRPANWVGGAVWWLEPLQARLAEHVFASHKLFADDTPIPVLDPGRGRTKTGRLWVYARDDRPCVDLIRQRLFTSTAPIVGPSVLLFIWRGSEASFRSTVIPASNDCAPTAFNSLPAE
jgi:hypothetical protein